ncbi:tautomerase family protein [Sandaracinobacter sp. RS1-74]|uniref:tautomerase family protein n=1 Tax=Sandaracinobacteroides sayramensis TaxID=2913411 RepID=UPI001EDC82ED|nr:tautomerase family protein [Sandaracinobacteroides sayramensis]MCG2842255.1 tautomerase family protein [Sandaracinobacteroides sayramensis]
MPLLRIDVIKGRSEEELKTLLQAIHDAMVLSFRVPDRDRYQVLTEHDAGRMILEDTGLGFERSHKTVLIHMTTRRRSEEEKQSFYRNLVQSLEERCSVPPEDVVISCVENSDADWSFGHGKAQFLTGEL